MNFKINKIGQSTEISHDLLYSMARNDDIIKSYYEASSYGVLAWYESESSTLVSPIDADDPNDPEWQTIAALTVTAEENRSIKLTLRGLTVTHESPSSVPSGNSAAYRHAINARFVAESPDQNISFMPYRFVASGRFMGPNETRQMGRIFGHNICLSTSEQIVWPASYQNAANIIRPGKATVRLEVKKLDVTQNVLGTGDSKFQVLVQDLGPWYEL